MKNQIRNKVLMAISMLVLVTTFAACSSTENSGPKPHPHPHPQNSVAGNFAGSNNINSSNSNTIESLGSEISTQSFCDHSHSDLTVKINGSNDHFTAVVGSKSQGHGVTMSCTHNHSSKILSCSSNVGPYKTTWTGKHNGTTWSGTITHKWWHFPMKYQSGSFNVSRSR